MRYKDLEIILPCSSELGFRNVVSTNGMFSAISGLGDPHDRVASVFRFGEFLDRVSPYLDWLALAPALPIFPSLPEGSCQARAFRQ